MLDNLGICPSGYLKRQIRIYPLKKMTGRLEIHQILEYNVIYKKRILRRIEKKLWQQKKC